jgi:NAD-dependent SIR2 family protein deacetylase
MDDLIKKAAADLSEAKMATALTGAGISTESGIPPFRGKGGLWEKYDPMEVERPSLPRTLTACTKWLEIVMSSNFTATWPYSAVWNATRITKPVALKSPKSRPVATAVES